MKYRQCLRKYPIRTQYYSCLIALRPNVQKIIVSDTLGLKSDPRCLGTGDRHLTQAGSFDKHGLKMIFSSGWRAWKLMGSRAALWLPTWNISLKSENLRSNLICQSRTIYKTPLSRYGRLGDVYIPRERGSGEHRGFAFVRFVNKWVLIKRDSSGCFQELDKSAILSKNW